MAAPETTQNTSRARDAMRRHEVLGSGSLCGIVGGVAMVGVAMIGATSQGMTAGHPLQVIGESFVGPEALDGAAKIAFGALVHAVTSVAFGILFAAIVPRDFPMASAIGVGVGLALLTLMFMMSLVVPWASPGFRRGMQDIGGSWVIAHAVFGVALGTNPALRRWLSREASDASVSDAERAGARWFTPGADPGRDAAPAHRGRAGR